MTQPRYQDRSRVESTRLPNRDYTASGWYFVTICTRQQAEFFGSVTCGQVHLSPIGEIAEKFWLEIPNYFTHAAIDAYVIMPNHIHGILVIDRHCQISDTTDSFNHNPRNVETLHCNVSTPISRIDLQRQFRSDISPKAGALGTIVRSHKSAVTHWCRQNQFDYFGWQPRSYDHIIRADGSLEQIRQYIINNPAKWATEREQPANLWM